MIRVLVYLGIILAGLCISPFLTASNGYLYLAIGEYEVETSIVFAVLALIVFYSALQLVEWLFVSLFNLVLNSRLLPDKWRKNAARKHTLIGALAVAEEDWAAAEKSMAKGAEKGELPTLNLLSAARAAHHQHHFESRDAYLVKAESSPQAMIAVGTARTRYLLQQGEFDLARQQLDKLVPTNKNKRPLLRLALDLYQAQGDWNALKLLLPSIKKQALLDDTQLSQLTALTNRSILNEAQGNSEQELNKVWHWLSRSERKQSEYLALYCCGLAQFDRKDEAKKLLLKQLKSDPCATIFAALADILTPCDIEARKQIFLLENRYNDNISFIVLLAKLHQQNKEYSLAETYWQKVCDLQPDKACWQALAESQQHLEKYEQAMKNYKTALTFD